MERIMSPGQIRTLFQPIVSFGADRCEVAGVEALSRGPVDTNVEAADVFFEYVRRKRREEWVDLACLKAAVGHAAALNDLNRLFVNVHASTLAKGQYFADGLETICSFYSFSPANVVIEVVEHSPYWNHDEFVRSTRRLRELGVRIAVDDLGVAYSSFKVILDANPDYLKIDMYITRGCCRDPVRRAMMKSFISLGDSLGTELIAEGIEDVEDLETLHSMGIRLFQGYLLAKPCPAERFSITGFRASLSPFLEGPICSLDALTENTYRTTGNNRSTLAP
jgi:EAL domain-containing protein (putative c-di-GMP-specific phosphodiesterase class I)